MTAAADLQVPNVETVLRRAATRLARAAGYELLDEGQVLQLVDVVRDQIVHPLAAGTPAAPDPATAEELTHKDTVIAELRRIVDGHARSCDRLKADKKRLAEQLELANSKLAGYHRSTEASSEQYRKHTEQVRALAAERDQLQAKLDDSVTVGNGWAEALHEAAEQRAALWSLLKDAVRERRQAWAEAARLEEALDERSSSDGERHRHYYPAEAPGQTPGPCACGKPWPRAQTAEPDDEPATEPDPWDRIFAGLRDDLADWPPQNRSSR